VPVAEESLRSGITLVLHGDTSRLPMMMQACHRWAGAVALSVLVYRGEELVAAERLLDRVAAERGRDRPLRWCAYRPPSIAPSARVSAGNEKATADVDGRGVADWVYPVNIMRNRALQLVETRQLMLIDGDFIPSDSMQQIARTGVEGLAAGSVLLVPPFQSRANVTSAGVADPQVVAALLRSKARVIIIIMKRRRRLRSQRSLHTVPSWRGKWIMHGGGRRRTTTQSNRYSRASLTM
jgi:hypothetical protein